MRVSVSVVVFVHTKYFTGKIDDGGIDPILTEIGQAKIIGLGKEFKVLHY